MDTNNLKLSTSPSWVKPVSIFALVFGVVTIFSGGSVLFGPAEAQESAGNFVGFVVWFNFLAGGAYVIAAIGLWLWKTWAAHLAAVIAGATALVAIGFAVVVWNGEAFEMRTVGAMAIRFVFWATVAFLGRRAWVHT